MPRYVNIALPLAADKLFSYHIPTEFSGEVVGVRALVPFRQRELTGVIVEELSAPPQTPTKPVLELLDDAPIFSASLLRFTRWVADYYLCSWGEVLKAALPPGMTPQRELQVRLLRTPTEEELSQLERRAPKRAALLRLLQQHATPVRVGYLARQLRHPHLSEQLHALEQHGYIALEGQPLQTRRPRRTRAVAVLPELISDPERFRTTMEELTQSSPAQARLLSVLYTYQLRNSTPMPLKEALRQSRASTTTLRHLLRRGLVSDTTLEDLLPAPPEAESPLAERNELLLPLTPEQEYAVRRVCEALEAGGPKVFLLRGVTGSGKTLVYLHAIRKALELGKDVLFLVPEIALTPQLIDRIQRAFPERVAVLHSRMNPTERFQTWRAIRTGHARVVLGARSAIFAPLPRLGLLIVDEEHEPSYKQEEPAPRYHARDCAVMRAHMEGAVAILGSATPSLESFYNAQIGKYHLLELRHRADGAQLPYIRIIDLRQARREHRMRGVFTEELLDAIHHRLTEGQGIILFHNRRGFARWLQCPECGHIPTCAYCSVSLTYHKIPKLLRCHYCGYSTPVPEECPRCGHVELEDIGTGTQRVEEELEASLRALYPQALIARMDSDTTTRKGAHRRLLQRFARGELHILVGTQMVAKGLDFPHVTLVGVINADVLLFLPDFRATERAFQLLVQVAGRAGRRSDAPGEVLIQTAHPDHPVVVAVQTGNEDLFYHDELQHRKAALYPPFTRFVVVELSGVDEEKVHHHAHLFAKCIPSHPGVLKLGPAIPTIVRVRQRYRRLVILKGLKQADPAAQHLRSVLRTALARYQRQYATSSVRLTVDVDAYGML
ncbi:MAG: primosomal protein N' [Candidatus Kapabacteria bacterium]|nr:primosomal protein N' [Candidatus Kapabacteria bacterium]MDW8012178.1 primosomal protein N' [Bacteroidota bacterium]